MRTLPLPFQCLPAAFGTAIDRFCFCHANLLFGQLIMLDSITYCVDL
jgi:hypothetical protein